MNSFDINEFRQLFPILSTSVNGKGLVYFDNGATTHKPLSVIDANSNYYQQLNSNVHRAAHSLSTTATFEFEQSREQVKCFINAKESAEIIWTKGATESINLVAHAWGLAHLKQGDEIVLTSAEHHANIVPWQILAEKVGAVIKVITLDVKGYFDQKCIEECITTKTKIVCFSHASNVVGKINPIDKVIKKAKSVGALTLVDGAQVIANTIVDVQALDCDFYVFSAHKMYGPTGVGVLYGKKELLNHMTPYQTGGEMIKKVSFSGTTFNKLPFKFEAGTPNISGVVAFSKALNLIEQHQLNNNLAYKQTLIDHCYHELGNIDEVKFIVDGKPELPIFSFVVNGEHHQDIASALDTYGIAVRSGHHCAMPLFESLKLDGCIRLSLAPYNTIEEIDFFIRCLNSILGKYSSADDCLNSELEHKESNSLLALFDSAQGWDGKHREIMMLGKNFPRMSREKRNEQTLVVGCESDAWLDLSVSKLKTNEKVVQISADSDAKIIRGLMAIVLAAYNNKTVDQILNFNIDEYFTKLGLKQHLSPSRGNGLLAIVDKIKASII